MEKCQTNLFSTNVCLLFSSSATSIQRAFTNEPAHHTHISSENDWKNKWNGNTKKVKQRQHNATPHYILYFHINVYMLLMEYNVNRTEKTNIFRFFSLFFCAPQQFCTAKLSLCLATNAKVKLKHFVIYDISVFSFSSFSFACRQ